MANKRANGEGNIRKRSDGHWEGRYTAGYDSKTGKRIIKNVLGKTQAEAKGKLKQAMNAIAGLGVSRTNEYTVANWLKTWYALYAKPNIRLTTQNRYELMMNIYAIPRIGDIKLSKLAFRDLQKLYRELQENGRVHTTVKSGKGLNSTTVRSLHLMVHCAFERAVKERLILRNPTDDCIAPKARKVEMHVPSLEHIKSYLGAAAERDMLAHVLSGTNQRTAKGLTGGAAMERCGHDIQHDLRQQAVRPQPQWRVCPFPTQDREFYPACIRATGSHRLAGTGAQQAPQKSIPFPIPNYRGDVPSRLGGEHPQKDFEGCGTPTPEIS